jgi:hypothetical protein
MGQCEGKATSNDAEMPTLHGDGVHDDSDALEALYADKAVIYQGAVHHGPTLPPGKYRASRPISLGNYRLGIDAQ